jgi:hypothetical protein
MSRQVDVSSISALRRFQAALRAYAETVQDVLAGLQTESQRSLDWVEARRLSYWPRQLQAAGEGLTAALNRLEMKQLTLDGRDAPSCTEERQDVHRARERLRYSEEQLSRIRQLAPRVQHQADEYQGVLAKLAQLIEGDVPRAIATLDRMATALEKYTVTTDRPAVEREAQS